MVTLGEQREIGPAVSHRILEAALQAVAGG
ncbi:hypothetical protein C8C99_3460 [Acidovorax sp. 107]|nr:hypothetical protein C8C99_3460 [Acidovorax sp. 107]